MRHPRSPFFRLAAALAPTLVLAACGSKVTEANYSRLKTGMTYQEVKGILDEPQGCDDALGLRNCRWGDDERWITIAFVADRVAVTAASNLR